MEWTSDVVYAEAESPLTSRQHKRILVVEDDAPVADFIRQGLEAEEYQVEVARDGEEAETLADEHEYDLLILDLGLPKRDGLEVLSSIRRDKKSSQVLILSGRSQVADRVKGLDSGADDYLAKPFSFSELMARVRALTRRTSYSADTTLRVEDLELDRMARTARRGSREIVLTQREFALLEYLVRNAGHSVTRAMIIEHVWHCVSETVTNVVDVYINYLRNKVDAGYEHRLIRTIRGVGYQLGQLNGEGRNEVGAASGKC